jgi:hypothetical protein
MNEANTKENGKMTNQNNLRFFWNGIKAGKGKLQKAHFSFIKTWTNDQGHVIPTQLAIYARDYEGFSAEVRASFVVENATDSMIDYFEKDSIHVMPDHPMFRAVASAYIKQEERSMKRGSVHAEQSLSTFKELFVM